MINFKRPDLLTWALTHRSLAYEIIPESLSNPTADSNSLSSSATPFLGWWLPSRSSRRFSSSREGELTRLRASLVSRRHLGEVAARIDLGSLLRLSRGEEQSGGRRKPALLANALEAVIAALYLDGGLDAARAFIEKHIIEPTLPDLHLAMQAGDTFSGAIGDHKSACRNISRPPAPASPTMSSPTRAAPTIKSAFASKFASRTSRAAPAPWPNPKEIQKSRPNRMLHAWPFSV